MLSIHFCFDAGRETARRGSAQFMTKVGLSPRLSLCIFAEKSVVFAEMRGFWLQNRTFFAENMTKLAV